MIRFALALALFAGGLGVADIDRAQAAETASGATTTVRWACIMRDRKGKPFTLTGHIENFPLAGAGPLSGQGSVTHDSSARFTGPVSVWQGVKQFDFSLFGDLPDGRKSLIALQIPRPEYADGGAGSVAIITPDDQRHGGKSFSEYVGSGFCKAEWTDTPAQKAM